MNFEWRRWFTSVQSAYSICATKRIKFLSQDPLEFVQGQSKAELDGVVHRVGGRSKFAHRIEAERHLMVERIGDAGRIAIAVVADGPRIVVGVGEGRRSLNARVYVSEALHIEIK
jgi:hypothetical protein